MRIFRRIQVLMGLIIVLAVGVVLIRLGDMARQDGAILEWSNTLVSKKVGATYAPRFFSQAVRDGPTPNVWVVSGDIALPRSGDGETRDQYVAIVRQVCKSRTEKKCWVLQSLTLGNEELAASAANGSRAGTVAAKGSAIEGNFSEQTNNGIVETEVNPLIVEPARTNGGVSIVIDAVDADLRLAPKAANGAAAEKAVSAIEVSANSTGNNVGKTVYLIQDRLNSLGYAKATPLELDGQFGPRTREAIAAYQRSYGMKIDGRASRELLHHIEGRGTIPVQTAEVKVLPPDTVLKAPSQGRFRVQLGAFRSSENALNLWRMLHSEHGDLLGGLGYQIKRFEGKDGGSFFYLYTDLLPTASSADSLCRTLIQRNVDCLADAL